MNKFFSYESGKFGKFLRIGKFTVAINPWGNCFSPALIVDTRIIGVASITLRTKSQLETTVFIRSLLKWDWNSGHLARNFGSFVDTDFGGYYRWNRHIDL